MVAIVLVGGEVLAAGETGIGWLNTAFALGAFASMILAARIRVGREFSWLIACTFLFILATVTLAFARGLLPALVAVLMGGLFTVMAEIAAVTHLQRLAIDQLAARVFGLYDTLAVGALTVCAGLAGSVSAVIGVRQGLLAICALVAFASLWLVRSGFRAGSSERVRWPSRAMVQWLPHARSHLPGGAPGHVACRGPAGLGTHGSYGWWVRSEIGRWRCVTVKGQVTHGLEITMPESH